ncbi:MAG: 3-dehydroquinate synthase [Chitinophagaceae bacterium]|nr:3-dehydroquinate synthase [Chitinophagaceae bacterium]
MDKHQFKYAAKTVDCYFETPFSFLDELVDKAKTIIITDENIAKLYADKFDGWNMITIKAGEEHKQQFTADYVIGELINLKADKQSFIIGVGGGVVTDIAGYVASVYMRGTRFGFVPTTILAMVDAAIGGKNGVDAGVYKNLIGVIKHPEILLYDYSFLETLPKEEWINGFAEIIKHACIKDSGMFKMLEENTLETFQNDKEKMALLVKRNVLIKYNVVSNDEFENGDRKLLNFGHTIGHAIENIYALPHGNAVSIGMVVAGNISAAVNNFSSSENSRLSALLNKYHLPTTLPYDESGSEAVWNILIMDKKRSGDTMNFILLNKIGDGIVKPILLQQLKLFFNKDL